MKTLNSPAAGARRTHASRALPLTRAAPHGVRHGSSWTDTTGATAGTSDHHSEERTRGSEWQLAVQRPRFVAEEHDERGVRDIEVVANA